MSPRPDCAEPVGTGDRLWRAGSRTNARRAAGSRFDSALHGAHGVLAALIERERLRKGQRGAHVGGQSIFKRLCEALDASELLADPRFVNIR